MGLLEGKVSVITGGTRGLGLGIAEAYAQEGSAVIIASRSKTAVEKAVQQLKGQGARAAGIAADMSNLSEAMTLSEFAIKTFGKFDVWVNNAGLETPFGPTMDYAAEEFEKLVQTNILGVYYGSRVALRHFAGRKSGKLINLVGRGYKGPVPFHNAYGASKAWVLSFTKALAKEYKNSGAEVLIFNPGLVITDMLTNFAIVKGHEEKVKAFPTVIRLMGKTPDFPARKAVWAASSATDGKSGKLINAFNYAIPAKGLLRTAMRRLTGMPTERIEINMRRIDPVEYAEP